MTKLMKDISNQPGELLKTLASATGEGRGALKKAAALLEKASCIYFTGIGSSWHAGMAPVSLLDRAGKPAILMDASELLHFAQFPKNAVVICLSRSGKSVEIVHLLDKAAKSNTRVIGITNTPDSPLAQRADVSLFLNAAFDHNVSITMYSALTLMSGLLVSEWLGCLDQKLETQLRTHLEKTEGRLTEWRATMDSHPWFEEGDVQTYFLARGGNLACAHETRLVWEEVAKTGACAMTTGGFRHGPQEIISSKVRIGMWLDCETMRTQDLALVQDLQMRGISVMLIGQNLKSDEADLVLELEEIPAPWQFLTGIIPGQIASEYLSHVRKVDCDSFLVCPYIIQDEGGL